MKRLLNIIGLPLLFVVSQFFMIVIATIIFIVSKNVFDVNEWIGTESFITELGSFLSKYNIVLVILSFLIFFPIFYKIYHKENTVKKEKIDLLDILLLIIFGVSFSLLYNCILGNINSIFSITNLFNGSSNIMISIITTVLVGPILEEYLFRGIVYHRLQKYYPVMKSLLLTGLIFSLCHTNIFQIIYAFIFNFMLIFTYERFNLKASIIVHISANLASLLFTIYIYSNLFLMELSLVIASILLVESYSTLKNKI